MRPSAPQVPNPALPTTVNPRFSKIVSSDLGRPIVNFAGWIVGCLVMSCGGEVDAPLATSASATTTSQGGCTSDVPVGDPHNTLALASGVPQKLAVDDESVYWTTWSPGQVLRCAKSGCNGKPTVVSTGYPWPYGIAVDGEAVYIHQPRHGYAVVSRWHRGTGCQADRTGHRDCKGPG